MSIVWHSAGRKNDEMKMKKFKISRVYAGNIRCQHGLDVMTIAAQTARQACEIYTSFIKLQFNETLRCEELSNEKD